MNLSLLGITINDINVSLEREKTIPGYKQHYYAKPVPVNHKSKLDELLSRYVPECHRITRNTGTAKDYTISAEDAVREIIKSEYPSLEKLVFQYDDKKFSPDGVVINRDNPQKPNYLIEIKTTRSWNLNEKKRECLARIATLQALRNSSALIMAEKVDQVFPKVVIGEYWINPYETPQGKKIPIILKRISIYKVRVCNSYMLDKELASLIYKYLGG
ncbi:MAG: hypothetical protein RXR08_09195 [Sulfolobaceae archaeon]